MLDELADIYRRKLEEYSWKCLQDYADIKGSEQIKSTMFQVVFVKYSMTRKDPLYKLTVIDPTLDPNDLYTCNFFIQDKTTPEPQEGDIILLKNALIRQFEGRPQLSKNRYTKFAVFNQQSENRYQSGEYQEEAGDQQIRTAFINWSVARFNLMNGSPDESHPMTPRGRRIITTDQIEEDEAKYFNYIGMIVGFFGENNQAKRREIKLTDFTKNPRPLARTDDIADDGMIGNITNDMTLLCTLYGKHAACGPFSFGDYVLLENCTRNTKNEMQLEIRVSSKDGDGDHVRKVNMDDPCLQPLLQRKREYEASMDKNASQMSETAVNLMRSRIPVQQTLVSIKQLVEKEEPGVEYIRVTIEKQRPSELTKWLKNYCSHCKITSVPTTSKELDACYKCNNMMKPVYRAMLKVRDESGSELAVLVMDEEADKLFGRLPAHRLKKDPALWKEFRKYVNYSEENSSGRRPYFSLGVKKYYNTNRYQNGWMYSIINTELILEDGNE